MKSPKNPGSGFTRAATPNPLPSSWADPKSKPSSRNAQQAGSWSIASGIAGLTILKTTKSAFTGYIKDKLTTLKPATDRIFGTSATVLWDYSVDAPDFASVRARIQQALLAEFAAHDSMSVQHTLYDMGKAALEARAGDRASR